MKAVHSKKRTVCIQKDRGRSTAFRALSRVLVVWMIAFTIVVQQAPAGATPKAPPPVRMRLHGYVTGRIDEKTILILDDQVHIGARTHISGQDADGRERDLLPSELVPGALIEADGVWTDHHQFAAETIHADLREANKKTHGAAYLQEDPPDIKRVVGNESAGLNVDGEYLLLEASSQREWPSTLKAVQANAGGANPLSGANPASIAGLEVHYSGLRRKDGGIVAERVSIGPPAPPDAFKLPHGMEVVRAQDPQTGIDILEFRRGKKVDGRLKLFPVAEVQTYVRELGKSLLPAEAYTKAWPVEFRFFVVEDSSINAESLPDGTILVNTGLLGAVENEAEFAFVLSHEISHVLQAHYWREVHETRPQRISLLIAGLAADIGAAAAGVYIGDLGQFLSGLGLVAIVNGHQRELENQADRLGLQNIIAHGYDPREAPKFSRMIIERYGNRTTSKLWSSHDSSVLRGSFMTIQLMRQYPEGHFDGAQRDSEAFRAMREAMGPVKIE